MSKVEKYTSYMEKVAKDDTHGYDQIDRMGNPNFDCSGLVITAVEKAGIKVKEAGATYTGNIKNAFKKCGFTDITKNITLSTGKGLKRGDVLLSEGHHVAVYCGNDKMVDARINENGKTTGGKSGDQTGHEIEIHSYNNHPWNCILRFEESTSTKKATSYKIGDKVTFNGSVHYVSSSKGATGHTCKGGKATITAINKGSAHPYHLKAVAGKGATVYGWVNAGTFK